VLGDSGLFCCSCRYLPRRRTSIQPRHGLPGAILLPALGRQLCARCLLPLCLTSLAGPLACAVYIDALPSVPHLQAYKPPNPADAAPCPHRTAESQANMEPAPTSGTPSAAGESRGGSPKPYRTTTTLRTTESSKAFAQSLGQLQLQDVAAPPGPTTSSPKAGRAGPRHTTSGVSTHASAAQCIHLIRTYVDAP
jgi:hypothetical protein